MAALILVLLRYIFLLLLYGFILHIILILSKELSTFAKMGEKAKLQTEPLEIHDIGEEKGAELVVLTSGSKDLPPGHRFILQEKNIIGRDHKSSITVNDPRISGIHAVIFLKEGNYWLEDAGSKNGTMLNNYTVNKVSPLNQGDEINLGKTTFVFSR